MVLFLFVQHVYAAWDYLIIDAIDDPKKKGKGEEEEKKGKTKEGQLTK